MNLIILKLLLLVAMVVLTLLAGLTPIKVLSYLRHSAATASSSQKHRNISRILCWLTCFSGGVFLATCFLHLFPELLETWSALNENFSLGISYPVAELVSCLGFFLLFFIEEIILMATPGHGHSHGNVDIKDFSQDEKLLTGAVNFEEVTTSVVDAERGKFQPDSEERCRTNCPPTFHAAHHRGNSQDNITPDLCNSVIPAEPERCEINCDKFKENPPILIPSKPHAHSHGVRSVTLIAALSFHSIVEGVALGITGTPTEAWTLFLSLMVHKIIVAFSVGLQLARTHAHALRWVVLSMFILAITSPIGSLFGMIVQNTMDGVAKEVLMTIFQGLAVGTFIYVTFFEVLLHERDNEHPNLQKLVFMLLGFALIGSLRLFDEGHQHGHSHIHGLDDHDHVHDVTTRP